MIYQSSKTSEKTRQFILYILKKRPNTSITGLMKITYLCDLISTKKLKKQISNLEYGRYNYGPFNSKIYRYIEELTQAKILESENDYGATGEEFGVYSVVKGKENKFDKITKDEMNVIDELLDSVRGLSAKILTEIAYKTKPMKKLGATLGGGENLGKVLDLNA